MDQELPKRIRLYFESFGGPIADPEWKEFESKIVTTRFIAGELFQSPNTKPDNVGLVLKGLFRIYYRNDEGKEFTRAFANEGGPIGDYASYIGNRLSEVTIEAIESSVVGSISFKHYFAMLDRYPHWNLIGRKIIESFYAVREKREADIAMLSALERYKNFLKDYPDIASRVTNHQAASYLGITPETLSRLKKST